MNEAKCKTIDTETAIEIVSERIESACKECDRTWERYNASTGEEQAIARSAYELAAHRLHCAERTLDHLVKFPAGESFLYVPSTGQISHVFK